MIAVRHKRRGIWHEVSLDSLRAQVASLASGLHARGVLAGERVALLGENRLEWIVADLALRALGAVVVTEPPFDTRLALCGDQEHVDAVDSPRVIAFDITGIPPRDHPRVESLDAVLASAAPDRELPELGEGARSAAAWLELGPGDRNLCLLPFAAATTRVLDIYAPLCAGATIQLPESAASVPDDLREAAPTVLTVVPRALELLERDSTLRPQRALYGWGMAHAGRVAGALVRRPVARKLGVHAVRRITCLDGPVPTGTANFFAALRVPVHEAFTFGDRVALAQGEPLPGIEATVRDGELVISGHATGERAELEGGRFRLLGRDGREPLERELRESRYVRQAVVVPGAGALLEVDVEMVAAWGAERDVAFGSYRSLAEHPSVRELLARDIPESIEAFAVLPRPLSIADGELTATLRVNRDPVVERFAPLLGES